MKNYLGILFPRFFYLAKKKESPTKGANFRDNVVWVDLLLVSCRSFSSGLLGFLLAELGLEPHDRLGISQWNVPEGLAFFLPLEALLSVATNHGSCEKSTGGLHRVVHYGGRDGLASTLQLSSEGLLVAFSAGGAGLLRLLSLSVHVVFVLVELAIHLTAIVLLVVLVVHNSSYFIVKLIVNIYTLSCRKLIRYNNL